VERMRLRYRHAVALPAPFCDWLDRLLEPMEEDRLGSAREALEALERALAPPPSSPTRVAPRPARTASSWRRHSGVLGIALVIAAAAVALWLSSTRRHRSTTPYEPPGRSLPSREAQHGPVLAGAETGGQIPVTIAAPTVPGLSFTTKRSHVLAAGLTVPQYVLFGRLSYGGAGAVTGLRGQVRLLDPKGALVDAGPLSLSCQGATLQDGEHCDGGLSAFNTIAGVVARVELVFTGTVASSPPAVESPVTVTWRLDGAPDVAVTQRGHGEVRRGYSVTAWVDLVFAHRGGAAMKYLEGTVRFANAGGETICRTAKRQFVGLETLTFGPGDRSPVRVTCLPTPGVRDTTLTSVAIDLQGYSPGD
jgi:hypothetical protein